MTIQANNTTTLSYAAMRNAARNATVDKGAELTALYSEAIQNNGFLTPADALEAVSNAKDKDRNRAVILYTADMAQSSFESLAALAASTSPEVEKQSKALVRIIKAMMIVDSLSANVQLNNWTHNTATAVSVAPVAPAVQPEQAEHAEQAEQA